MPPKQPQPSLLTPTTSDDLHADCERGRPVLPLGVYTEEAGFQRCTEETLIFLNQHIWEAGELVELELGVLFSFQLSRSLTP